ncbi:S8 family serine peptidase [Pontibacter oryzae]|uniref:T9SS C-terminal target domain-containing protein n=1 Tax=Pontibacter oryzae TaxID=2304593 RepID=A0A399SEC4_9BACT|nr:S8 family serine peptidase [Pontibacter oryzae]RIJ41541.1 T9SS C-terminal target domain-containing protein [Pontibacter oryzae]
MRYHLLLFLSMLVLPLKAQQTTNAAEGQKRLVYFTDKEKSPYSFSDPEQFLSAKSIARRQRQNIPLNARDLPVDPAYVAGLKQTGITVWYTSRWFNAAVVQCTDEQLEQLSGLSYIKSTRTLNRSAQPEASQLRENQHKLERASSVPNYSRTASIDYGLTFHQADMLGTDELHAAGYTGTGMTVAVFDAGFPGVNTISAFSHLFQGERLKGTFDFVKKEENVFSADWHGTAVLSTMAAYEPGKIIGTAYDANYILLRTEDAATEHNIEEINWLIAAEYADSVGADVINSSLGYTLFDAPSTSYSYADMDGNTSLVTKAADLAAAVGILVVVAAGNEGNNTWRYISAPADADSVLTVGAVDSLGAKAFFSSFGPTADGRIKPDVVAMGYKTYVLQASGNLAQSNGTSFSSPIMAGFAASLWQANPSKTNLEIIALLRQIGSNSANPNNSIGYGIPSYSTLVTALPVVKNEGSAFITNPVQHGPIVLTLGEEWHQQSVDVQLIDITGKRVFQQRITSALPKQVLELQPQRLQKGLYVCRIRSGSRTHTLRFVKL